MTRKLPWHLAILVAILATQPASADLAANVSPFAGTAISSLHDHGNTVPGATRPFGMLYWGPDLADDNFYRWAKPVTRGFGLTHISGPGCAQFGDAPVFPMVGVPIEQAAYRAPFRHQNEVSEPGYYSVLLDSGIRVRIAAHVRSGIAEFEFPESAEPHTLAFDVARNVSPRIFATEFQITGSRVTGSVTSGANCEAGPNRYRVYFSYEPEQTPQSAVAFGAKSGYLSFAPSVKVVRLKVGISFVSVANAEANLKSAIPGWDFESVRRTARAVWNDALSRIEVRRGSGKDVRLLYTALYRALLHPSVFSDVNGDYIGFDERVHNAGKRIQYANFSAWDIYRSQVVLLAMLFPDIASDMAQSLVNDAEQGGGLPLLPLANDDTNIMVGDPCAAILAQFYAFGARNFDAARALEIMVRGATDPRVRVRNSHLERPFLPEYLQQGYIFERGIPGAGAAAVTLEYQNADFAIAQLAAALGDTENERKLLAQSSRWRTLFDPQTRYIRARNLDGEFLPGFSPEKEEGFVEGNAAQYTWMVPYDLKGVIEAVGGPDAARQRLDHYFSAYYLWESKNGPFFAIGNEPSFGNPWVYNWTGHPWRTQEVVRKTLRDLFSAEPDGLPGNDDLGATSAWILFAQLGLYPSIPGVGGFTLNSPVFPEAILHLGQRKLRILAPGAPDSLYIQGITLDGKPLRTLWIGWLDLSAASNLDFALANQPSRQPLDSPPSYAP
jgi:predicted alpha-1,2-mannosidase